MEVYHLSNICEYLDRCGVSFQAVKPKNLESLFDLLKPNEIVAILHVDNGKHFIALKKGSNDQIIALDGTRVIKEDTLSKMQKRFSGIAVILGSSGLHVIRDCIAWSKITLIIGAIPCGFGIGLFLGHCLNKKQIINTIHPS